MKEKSNDTIKITGWRNKPEIPEGVELGIKEGKDGYFITKWVLGEPINIPLTNFTAKIDAVIVRADDERDRKITITHKGQKIITYFSAESLTNATKFCSFLLNNLNFIAQFEGTDYDLKKLVKFWGEKTDPLIVRETECVGEIQEGFITENVFVSNTGEIKELSDGFLNLEGKRAIKLGTYTTQEGKRARTPVFPLTEPAGGIDKFKEKVFDLMIKNRNLKVAIAIGWLKATMWSGMFFKHHNWFPLFMLHGKHQGGKSCLSDWLMSMVGLRTSRPIALHEGLHMPGLERPFAYYSGFPVLLNDYKNEPYKGQQFHSFFNNVFDRSCVPKGKRDKQFQVREMHIRGCLMLNGETSPADAGLNSRMITFEITKDERNKKYYRELLTLEPEFSHIGFDWIKNRVKGFGSFLTIYNDVLNKIESQLPSPRQAQCWAVALAGALTEPYFKDQEEKLIGYTTRLANQEIKYQTSEDVIHTLWEAADILSRHKKLIFEAFFYDWEKRQIRVSLPLLLSLISSENATRKYANRLPSDREVEKLIRQEPYFMEKKKARVPDGKAAYRCILDINNPFFPEILKNMIDEEPENNDHNAPNVGNL